MLYFWLDHTDYQFFQLHSLLSVPVFNVTYALISAVLTLLTHYFILKHLMKCFVNLPDVSDSLRQRRHIQNVANFKRNLASTCFRFTMTFPLFLTSLFPIDFLKHTEGILVYLSLHLLSSIYESCGPAFAYLSNRNVFERRRNRIGHYSDHQENTLGDVGNTTVGPSMFLPSASKGHTGQIHTSNRKAAALLNNREPLSSSEIDSGLRTGNRLAPSLHLQSKKISIISRKDKRPFSFNSKKSSKVKPKQKLQHGSTLDVVTSSYCNKHFVAHKDTLKVKSAQTKIYVLKKGKIQEETEENIGWLCYTEDKDKIYMKRPGSYKCPKCNPPYKLPIDKRKALHSINSVNSMEQPQDKGGQHKELLQLNINMFYERPSDSNLHTSPSINFVYKDFETN